MFISFFLNVEKVVLNDSMAAKMASRVSYLVYYYCKQSEFEILRCCSESIPMKFSDLLICIIKIMWRDLKKKIVWVVSEIYKKGLKVQTLNEVPLTVVANQGVNAGGIVATVVSADLAFVYVWKKMLGEFSRRKRTLKTRFARFFKEKKLCRHLPEQL